MTNIKINDVEVQIEDGLDVEVIGYKITVKGRYPAGTITTYPYPIFTSPYTFPSTTGTSGSFTIGQVTSTDNAN